MAHPSIGDVVHVWPHPGRRVRSHDPAILARYFDSDDGCKLPWSLWLETMHGEGHVYLTDPRGKAKEPIVGDSAGQWIETVDRVLAADAAAHPAKPEK